MRELELKFHVPDPVLASLQQELTRRRARAQRLAARYFDTPDRRLGAHRIALRLRNEGGHWVQTLKAAPDSPIDRLEHDVPLRVQPGTVPALDPARHDGTEAGARLRAALGDDGAPQLVECWSTDVLRRACWIEFDDGSAIEAALDIGAVRAGDRHAPLVELELELKAGRPGALFELARLWCGHGGLWFDARSKAQRGALLAAGREHAEPAKARPSTLAGTMDGRELQRAVLRSVLDQVLANASEVAAGATTPEHVHQLRIGLRRLRTALRELAPLAPGLPEGAEVALARAFGRLGATRDRQAVASAVRPLLVAAGAPRVEWDEPADADAPADVVTDAGLQDLLLRLLQCAHDDAPAEDGVPAGEVRAALSRRLARLHRDVVRAGRRFEALTDEQQHRTRKRLKRLRYLAEFVAPLWPGKGPGRYLEALSAAQDALGRHRDVVVGAERFRADAERDPRSWFAAGWLQGHRAVTARASHRALGALAGAPRFWKEHAR